MSKVIDLKKWREQKERKESAPLPGVIVWLHCSQCETTEYTELQIKGGRFHKCGTLVEEVEVPIDVRAEYTIAQRNLKALKKLPISDESKISWLNEWYHAIPKWWQETQFNEKQYLNRLQLIAKKPIQPYPDDWQPEKEGMVEILSTGIVITPARQPNLHFPPKE